MTARDYQVYAAQSVWDYFTSGKQGNPLILMPTATGKSHVIATFAQSVLHHYPQSRILVLTHVKELIQQNYNKLVGAWPNAPAGIYSASLGKRDIFNSIIYAGIQSVTKRAAAFGHVDLVIIDEAHLVSPDDDTSYVSFLNGLRSTNPSLRVIGLTATGWRLGYGKIWEGDKRLFTDVCCDMTSIDAFNWFIAQGYLSPLIPRKTKLELDVSGVHMQGGDFIQRELQNAVDKLEVTQRALEEAMQYENRHKWLIFASGVEHAMHIAQQLSDLGVPCGYVHGKMSGADRDRVLADHKSGRIKAIANANILTTGYDDPGIDLILVLRPTMSPVLWVQMLGRGTRPCYADGYNLETLEGRLAAMAASHKQNCLVLDYAGNTRQLGPINDPVIPRKKGEKASMPAPVKECPQCETYNHASARFCCACGAEFVFQTKLKQAASSEELLKGEAPKVEIFTVDSATYQSYQRPGKPRMLRVSYYCGLRKFDEYVCLEHPPGYAKHKANKWLRERGWKGAPETVNVDDVLNRFGQLRIPTHLQVWVNKKPYTEIMSYDYTGTAFGTREVIMDSAWPQAHASAPSRSAVALTADANDDDIPF